MYFPLTILKPSPGEVFYLRRDIPLELQEIILKANKEVKWFYDKEELGSAEFIFIPPTIGKHQILAQTETEESSVEIEVSSVE